MQHYDPDEGAGITTSAIGAFGRHRFQDAVEWSTWLSMDRLGSGEDGHVRMTYDTWVTVWPSDVLRFDVGSNRTTFDNVRSLQQNIVATHANLSMDVLPNELTRFVGRCNWGDYSDGNQRLWGQVIAERRLRSVPRVVAGLTGTAFRFDELLDNGYYNPSRYVSYGATLRTFNVEGDRFWFDVSGMAGAEHASPADEHFIWSLGAQLRFGVTQSASIIVHAHHYSSATASSSGFARTNVGIALRAPLY